MECFRFFFCKQPRRIIPIERDPLLLGGGFEVSRQKRPAHRGMCVLACQESNLVKSQATDCIWHARDEAARLGYDFAAPAMLLWGAVADASSVSAKVLRRMGVQLEDLRQIAADEMCKEEAPPSDGSGLTPEALWIILISSTEAEEALNFKVTGNAAVLIALCRDRSGKVQKVLEMLNVDPNLVRAEIIKELEEMQKAQLQKGGGVLRPCLKGSKAKKQDAGDDVMKEVCNGAEESMTPRRSFASTSTCTPPEGLDATEVQAMATSVSRQESSDVEQKVNRPQATYYVGTTVLVRFEGKTMRFFHPPAINARANAIKVFR